MTNPFSVFRDWLGKIPEDAHEETEKIDQAIQELRMLNVRREEVLTRVQQPDILRSLVISMNSGRNR